MTTPIPWSMKKRRPIVAPGWISTPVSVRVTFERTRAGSRYAGRPSHSRCATRCDQTACSPGEVRNVSSRDWAAGSRAIAASTSSRAAARTAATRPAHLATGRAGCCGILR